FGNRSPTSTLKFDAQTLGPQVDIEKEDRCHNLRVEFRVLHETRPHICTRRKAACTKTPQLALPCIFGAISEAVLGNARDG
ncbi:hypothetical protein PISMIDRAFT_680865, partial [Pisolithus microcarpus 441]